MQTNRIKRVLLNLKITSHMSSAFNTAESKIISAFLHVFHGLSIIKCKVKGARCSFSVWPLAGSKPSSYSCAHHAQATILILIRRKAPLSPTVSAYRKQKLCFGAFRRIVLLLCIYTIIKITPPTILLFFKKGQVMQFCLLMHIIVMKKG